MPTIQLQTYAAAPPLKWPASPARSVDDMLNQPYNDAMMPVTDDSLSEFELPFDRIPMGMAVLDREFRIRCCNPAWADFLSRCAPATTGPLAIGAPCFDHLPGSEPMLIPLLERALAGETVRQDAVRFESGASVSYWHLTLTPLIEDDDMAQGILCAVIEAAQEREQTLETLHQREERLALVMEAINDGVWDWNTQTGESYFSPRWKSMLDYTDDEIPNEFDSWARLIHPDDRERTLAAIQEHLDGHTPLYRVEHRLRHKDGDYRWILARGNALRRDDGTPYRMVGSHTDITARKLAEDALRTSEAHLRSLLENARGFAIYRLVVDPSAPYGARVSLISPSAQEILSLADPTRFESWFGHIHPDDLPRVLAANQKALETGVPYTETTRWYHRERGEWIWIHTSSTPVPDEAGHVTHFDGLILDVTDQKQAEVALRESQRQLSTLISNLPGMAYRCRNDTRWTMEFVSEGALELTGYSAADLIANQALSYGDLVHPDDREMVWREVQAALKEDRPFQLTYRLNTSQSEKWVWEQGRGVVSPCGEIVALEGFVTDITPRVMAQRNLEARVEERTSALSTLLRVSYNINSTLELDSLLDLVLDQLRAVVDYTGASIQTLDDGYLTVRAYSGPLSQDQLPARRLALQDAPASQEVIRRREPVMIANVWGDTQLARMYQRTAGGGLKAAFGYARSWLSVPLMVKGEVRGILTLDHSQPGFFTPQHADLVMTFANQVAVAIENARLYEHAEESAVAAERNRLARDLHDAVTQTLFSSSLIADVLPRIWERDQDEGIRRLTELRELTRGALAEMRTLLLELRPSALQEANLEQLLQQLCESIAGRARVPVTLKMEGECTLPAEIKVALYRIAQEALNNVAKHSLASHATIRLRCEPGAATLCIRDDGSGFDPGSIAPSSLGLGIMRERAEAIGAQLEIQSQPGAGTQVSAIWKADQNGTH